MEVRKEKCKTCPFRADSPYKDLVPTLTISSMSEASRICHSTGKNAIQKTNKPELICRGSRDIQLTLFASMGFIEEATDSAWDKKWNEMCAAPRVNLQGSF